MGPQSSGYIRDIHGLSHVRQLSGLAVASPELLQALQDNWLGTLLPDDFPCPQELVSCHSFFRFFVLPITV